MPVVDTSVLVPAFDADHPNHERARRALAEPGALHITGGVIAEFTTVLRRKGNDAGEDGALIAREALASLEALPGFRHAVSYDVGKASRLFHATPSLSYVDAWGIVLAEALGEGLVTFDAEQAAASRERRGKG